MTSLCESVLWKDKLSADVIRSVFEKVSQSNSIFNAMDSLVLTVHSGRMPVSFGKHATTSRSRTLTVMSHLKSSIVQKKQRKTS